MISDVQGGYISPSLGPAYATIIYVSLYFLVSLFSIVAVLAQPSITMQPPAKRRHLGRHSKGAQSSSIDPEAAPCLTSHGTHTLVIESDLVYDVLKKWSWGQMQATEVQHVCMQVYNDFKRVLTSIHQSTDHIPKDLHLVASLGKYGEYPGNVKRDLLSILGNPMCPFVLLC